MTNHRVSIFNKYIKDCFKKDKASINPSLKSQAQIPLLIDTLCRQQHHHLLLIKSSAEKFNDSLIEALAYNLSTDNTSSLLQAAHFIYFDVTAFLLSAESHDDIVNDFRILCDDLQTHNKCIVFVMNQLEPFLSTDPHSPLATLGKLLRSTLMNKQWRHVLFTHSIDQQSPYSQNHPNVYLQNTLLKELFTPIKINEPTTAESLAILKNHRLELEDFHQVIISEEALPAALSLVSTYFSDTSILDKAIQLLDHAAAHATTAVASLEQKAIVTSLHLSHVVSSWTHIPLCHLQNNRFQMNKLMEALQNNIYGQNHAIQTIAAILQNSYIKLHKKSGPLCNLLLAGPAHTGKTFFAEKLAEYLFGHNNALIRLNMNKNTVALSDLIISTGSPEKGLHLFTAIQQIPYAVVLFENVEQLSPQILSILTCIVTDGYVLDRQGKKYDFSHAIIIITTTRGADKIVQAMQVIPEKNKQMDLMQLILNDTLHDPSKHFKMHISSPELSEQMLPHLIELFSVDLIQHVHLVLFSPLDYDALEKLLRDQLKKLVKHLDLHFGIELNYAPEVITFLMHEALRHTEPNKSLGKLLEQHLYSCVSHEMLVHIDNKHKPRRLLLQLNDGGQLLRCKLITTSETELS